MGMLKPEVPTQWGENQRHWHLDKTISISHLISLGLVLGMVWGAVTKIEKKTEANALEIQHLKAVTAEREDRAEQLRREIKADFVRVHEKLDQIISR